MAEITRAMWEKGIQIDAGKMRWSATDDHKQRIAVITKKWKEGFAQLKEENDRLQEEDKAKHAADLEEIKRFVVEQRAQWVPGMQGAGY